MTRIRIEFEFRLTGSGQRQAAKYGPWRITFALQNLRGIIPEYNVGGLVLGRIEADVYKNIVQHADFAALKHVFKICALFTAPNSISQKLAIFSPPCWQNLVTLSPNWSMLADIWQLFCSFANTYIFLFWYFECSVILCGLLSILSTHAVSYKFWLCDFLKIPP